MEDLYISNLLAFLLIACGVTIYFIIRSYRKALK